MSSLPVRNPIASPAGWALLLSLAAQPALAAPAVLHALDPSPDVFGPGSVEEYALKVEAPELRETETVDLVLPDGLYIAQVERIEERSTGVFWRGRIHKTWEVLLTEHEGVLAGLIYTPWVVYELTTGPDGAPRLVHVDHDAFPGCGTETADQGDAETELKDGGDDAASDTTGVALDGAVSASSTQPVVIDLLVVYTPQARTGAGGVSQIQSTIQAAVDATNTAYANSQVNIALNVVHTAETNFNDSGSSSTDLTNVRFNSQVLGWRDTYGADMVALIVNGNDACGRAYVQRTVGASFASFAFSVTTRSCAVGNLTFAHELGHNQGCEHDPANGTSPSSASYPYSFGHFHSGSYRTVMFLLEPVHRWLQPGAVLLEPWRDPSEPSHWHREPAGQPPYVEQHRPGGGRLSRSTARFCARPALLQPERPRHLHHPQLHRWALESGDHPWGA